jgi:pimeloyl-ACP methyl ester carboxylesterase
MAARWITGVGPAGRGPAGPVPAGDSRPAAHGKSTGGFDFEAAVRDVFALLDALPAGRVVLVGLSLGGNLAQEVARRAPDRVSAIVVADATCNTEARHPLATALTAAALNAHAMLPGNHLAYYAA